MSLRYLGKREPRTLSFQSWTHGVMLGIRRDHPRRRIKMKFCMVAGFHEVALRSEFHRNRLSSLH